MTEPQFVNLRHSAWYGDSTLGLSFPANWKLDVHSPAAQQPLSEAEIDQQLQPVSDHIARRWNASAEGIAILCDDLTRPTPVDVILPTLLRQLASLGVPSNSILISTGGGTHAPLDHDGLCRKLGADIVRSYRVLAHDPYKDTERIGTTRNGTPIMLNRFVLNQPIRVGIGGVYPHALAGFGGGAKLSLGFCGFKTIAHLHYRFQGSNLGGSTDNPFRKELEEIDQRLNLASSISVVINERRQVTQIFENSHAAAVDYCRARFGVEPPTNADLVIVNTYPFDTMYHFSKKGWWPIKLAPNAVGGVIIGGFPGGLGHHGLHPMRLRKWKRAQHKLYVLSNLPISTVAAQLSHAVRSRLWPKRRMTSRAPKPICFQPCWHGSLHGDDLLYEWEAVIERMQSCCDNPTPQVSVYTCAPLLYPIS